MQLIIQAINGLNGYKPKDHKHRLSKSLYRDHAIERRMKNGSIASSLNLLNRNVDRFEHPHKVRIHFEKQRNSQYCGYKSAGSPESLIETAEYSAPNLLFV